MNNANQISETERQTDRQIETYNIQICFHCGAFLQHVCAICRKQFADKIRAIKLNNCTYHMAFSLVMLKYVYHCHENIIKTFGNKNWRLNKVMHRNLCFHRILSEGLVETNRSQSTRKISFQTISKGSISQRYIRICREKIIEKFKRRLYLLESGCILIIVLP